MIHFSRHARERMLERHISIPLVKKIIENLPNIRHIEGDKFICYDMVQGRKLVIIFLKCKQEITIITAYYEN